MHEPYAHSRVLSRHTQERSQALRAGDADARHRLLLVTPATPANPSLCDVQLALAREHGLPGWVALRAALDDLAMDTAQHRRARRYRAAFGLGRRSGCIGPMAKLGVTITELCSTDLGCVMPRQHRLAQKKTLTPSDIKDEQLVGLSRHLPLGVQVERMFADTNVPLRFAVEVTQSTMALSLVRAGAGVALLDGFSCLTAWGSDLPARPLAPPTKSFARILTARDRPLARLAVEFCDILHDVAGEIDFELPRAKRR